MKNTESKPSLIVHLVRLGVTALLVAGALFPSGLHGQDVQIECITYPEGEWPRHERQKNTSGFTFGANNVGDVAHCWIENYQDRSVHRCSGQRYTASFPGRSREELTEAVENYLLLESNRVYASQLHERGFQFVMRTGRFFYRGPDIIAPVVHILVEVRDGRIRMTFLGFGGLRRASQESVTTSSSGRVSFTPLGDVVLSAGRGRAITRTTYDDAGVEWFDERLCRDSGAWGFAGGATRYLGGEIVLKAMALEWSVDGYEPWEDEDE